MEKSRLKKSVALDANLLIDLGADKDYAHTFLEVLQGRGFVLLAPPTALMETAYKAEQGNEDAWEALQGLGPWKITGLNPDDIEQVIAERFAERLIASRLIPETERNDAIIVAETALFSIPFLATLDKHLLNIPSESLAIQLAEADLDRVDVVEPRRLLRLLR